MTILFDKGAQLKFSIRSGLSIIAICFLVTACATTGEQSENYPNLQTDSNRAAKGHFNNHEIEKRLRQEYKRWKGTRHRLGGTSQQGIDCSGFVQAIYRETFNITLPRTTKAQVKQGRAVHSQELQAGDLVFFNPPGYPRHVGIYLNRSEFIHASKKKGVTISTIDRYYWGKYYWTARRILPTSE